ncbi:MAG: hypothetical protein AB7U83_03675 [Vicinamibacterales bacterium]
MRRLTTRLLVAVVAVAVACGGAEEIAAQGLDIPTGVFVETDDGPQEVGVYTDRAPGRRMRLAVGTLDEVQQVSGVIRLVCNLPLWRVQSVWLSTARVFASDRAVRRTLPVRMRRLTMSTTALQVAASEQPATFRRLLDAVGATADNPAYVFVTLRSGGLIRDYVIGVRPDE